MCKVVDLHRVRNGKLLEKVLTRLKRTTQIITVDELEAEFRHGNDLRNRCVITIDDGDKSSYNVIYPLLKKLNIPATLFISPIVCLEGMNYWFQEIEGYDGARLHGVLCEYLGINPQLLESYSYLSILKSLKINQIEQVITNYRKRYKELSKAPQNINKAQILEMDQDGLVTFGAHTLSHPILANEDSSTSEMEVQRSIESLSELLDHEVKYFSYPNGLPVLDYGLREEESVRNAGCRMAFSNHLDRFTLEDNPLRVPRYALEIPDTGSSLVNGTLIKTKLFLGSHWDQLKNYISPDEASSRIKLRERLQQLPG